MEDPPRDAAINVLGSLNVLEAARKHGVRKVMYAATGGAAVGEPKYLPVDEDHPVEPLSPYGASKHAVEHYVALYRQTFSRWTRIAIRPEEVRILDFQARFPSAWSSGGSESRVAPAG